MRVATVTLAGNVSPAGGTLQGGATGKYNLYAVLTGVYTTGVTFATGTAAYGKTLSPNTTWVKIQNDLGNVGQIYIGDVNVSLANKAGYPISKGGEWMVNGDGFHRHESLSDIWIAVTDNAQIVEINFA